MSGWALWWRVAVAVVLIVALSPILLTLFLIEDPHIRWP